MKINLLVMPTIDVRCCGGVYGTIQPFLVPQSCWQTFAAFLLPFSTHGTQLERCFPSLEGWQGSEVWHSSTFLERELGSCCKMVTF